MSRKRSPPDLDSPPGLAKQPRLHPYQPLPFSPLMPLVEARAPRPIPLVPPPPYSVAMVSSSRVPMATPVEEPDLLSPSQFLSTPSTTSVTMTTSTKRNELIKSRKSKLESHKMKHITLLKEKFFLKNDGQYLEFSLWSAKPNIPRETYLRQNSIETAEVSSLRPLPPVTKSSTGTSNNSPGESVPKIKPLPPLTTSSSTTVQIPLSTVSPGLQKPANFPGLHLPLSAPDVKTTSQLHTPITSTSLLHTPSTSQLHTPSTSTPLVTPMSVTTPGVMTPRTLTPGSPLKTSFSTPSPRPVTRTQSSFSSVYESSHEDIVHRARHEADVKKAIAELRKEGLWSACRLPKVMEPPRNKTHWHYLLEEMQWLATDFVNERRWKINAAKKLSRSVARYHSEQELAATRAEKEDQVRLRKIASNIAKEVKFFWDSVAKVVEHKQSILLEEKRKRAMDLHLDYIVDQTTKYSKWLVKGLGSAVNPSLGSTASQDESDEFIAVDQSDNEESIAREEELLKQEGAFDYSAELEALQNEAEMPIEKLVESLPKEILTGGDSPKEEGISPMETGDDEYNAASGSASEDEATISEQEEHEGEQDHLDEMNALSKEGELPLEDLLAAYNLQRNSVSPQTDVESEGLSRSVSVSEGAGSGEESDSDDNADLELLVSGKTLKEACQTEAGLTDVAAVAEKFQPKGITLATTEVKTKVPFLLKHTLREYQHIGLDWLVAMHNRKLNGILADEMGLGKTIQTIALLAHLACETGNWGPHLIIVPTSVMLNWELELKKWCPAFKILTYFGSLKERKQKRVGWSKRNAFHVCVTSYNIAVTDHRSFKQRRWKYLILDEAQHIKNFKSQRWQTLLNFNSQQRLLLTGTPLQNNLMELWSLMHFLMPAVFSSHSDFKEWFSNPLTGMVEGSQEYNASIVKRLHQVLRPFLLHRRKMEVEKQMPQKYEHLVPCSLSKRQRFLYNEYMSRAKTKDSIASGNYLSVINILMQLRKVCNHPDLFELRPITSPYRMTALEHCTASLLLTVDQYHPFETVSLDYLNLNLIDCELTMEAFQCHRARQLQLPRSVITDQAHHDHVTDSDEEGIKKKFFLDDLHLPKLEAELEEMSLSNRRHLTEVNCQRCRQQPVYGRDMVGTIRKLFSQHSKRNLGSNWNWSGHASCLAHQTTSLPWTVWSSRLAALLPSLVEREEQLADIIERFVITVPRVTAPSITLHTYHPPLPHLTREQLVNETLTKGLPLHTTILHRAATRLSLQFPETRLIQYDCGKLQTMALLLTRLKAEGHRALVFTQMGRVLDVLEIFLNYHGHTYLRLDGSTPVVKRQYLMERFNRDERIFCFILSTRSGGLGVNLTGADTVIFYDSDWNPTMDAQAQDRCHRIGQTRDVHIYRLICSNTVEENILKKANQKKLLGHIAIEGGGFTTDFFKQASIKELFESSPQNVGVFDSPPSSPSGDVSQKQVEEMLMSAEDEGDARAATKARDEQVAELAEFDEAYNSSNTGQETGGSGEKVRSEFAAIDDQLSSVERYAMRYLEEETAGAAAEQLKQAEESIEQAKRDWELSHLKSLRQEEQRLAEEEADDMQLTFDRPDNSNKVFMDEQSNEEMPVWLPPTPPAEDGEEMYFDLVLDLSYDTSHTISPAVLAAIAPFSEEDYDVFGLSRRSQEYNTVKKSQKSSIKHSKEHSNAPPSLFWRRPAVDTLSTKLKKLASHQKKLKSKDQFTPLLEQHPEGPDWMYIEDWILLKSVTVVLEFPLSLTISVPGHTPNWSIVADITSSLSRIRRAPFQCREHLMNVVLPREDHTLKHDDQDSKKVKARDGSTKKTKARREQRTKSHVISDGGKEQGRLYSGFFDWIHQASSKRKKAPKFTWEASQMQSMHADLLKEYNIQLDNIQSPIQVAQQRADRLHTSRASYTGGIPGQFKSAADMAKVSGYNVPRQSTVSTGGKFPSLSTATPSVSPSKIATVSSSGPTPLPSVSASAPVSKAFTGAVNISELGKTLIARSTLTPQQLLLLRQSTLQPQPSSLISPTATAVPQTQPSKTPLQQKIGLDQLRASVGSVVSVALPISQRLSMASITSTSGITTPTLRTSTGRPLQTEEVLALLKQQQIRVGQFKAAASKEASSSPSPRAEAVKSAASDKSPLTSDTGVIKVEMAPSTAQKPQTVKLVSSSSTQSRPSPAAIQQVTSAQFQQVLALHQAAQAAKNAASSREQPK